MYTISRTGLTTGGIQKSVPSLAASVLIAELFYKFHSFTLEFMAALATWYALDVVSSRFLSMVSVGRGKTQDQG